MKNKQTKETNSPTKRNGAKRWPEPSELAMIAGALAKAHPQDDMSKLTERAMQLWVASDEFLAARESEEAKPK